MNPDLRKALVEVHTANAILAPFLAELAAAEVHGNPDRIGNAAYDALAKADLLAASLSHAFAVAADRPDTFEPGAAQPFERRA